MCATNLEMHKTLLWNETRLINVQIQYIQYVQTVLVTQMAEISLSNRHVYEQ